MIRRTCSRSPLSVKDWNPATVMSFKPRNSFPLESPFLDRMISFPLIRVFFPSLFDGRNLVLLSFPILAGQFPGWTINPLVLWLLLLNLGCLIQQV